MDFIDLKTQQKLIRKNIDKRISNVLNHGQYIQGPEYIRSWKINFPFSQNLNMYYVVLVELMLFF